MNIRFIKSSEKKRILNELNEKFGVDSLPYLLIGTGKERIRAFSGSMSKDEIMKLGDMANVELIGSYIMSGKDEDLRFNFDFISLIRKKITNGIVDIDELQFYDFIRGKDISLKCEKGVVVLRHEGNLVGVGKSNGEKIFNYIPKERRIKIKANNKTL